MQYYKPLVCLSAGANPTFFVILRHSRRISINKFTPPDFSGGVLTCFILSGTQNRPLSRRKIYVLSVAIIATCLLASRTTIITVANL